MILSDIIHAITEELKYFFIDKAGTVILDTQLADDATYDFPLCIIETDDDSESARLPGNGLTRIDLNFTFRVYNYEPNAYNDDDGGYSTTLLDIIDQVRQYFENETWYTQEMVDLTTNYGFRLTFGGSTKAEPITNQEGKIALGRRITFMSIAYDQETRSTDLMNITHKGTNSGTVVFQ
jgi:hypothetical protein